MSKKSITVEDETLKEVKVVSDRKRSESHGGENYEKKVRSKSKVSTKSSDFVYVNNAYVGSSMNSVNEPRIPEPPVTSVIREQYWTCSKWPLAQRVLAIAVGVLLGAVIGLAVTMIIRSAAPDMDIAGIFKTPTPD